MKPVARRGAVAYCQENYSIGERHACRLVGISRSVLRYRSRRGDDSDLRDRIKLIARQRQPFGHLRITAMLRREGLRVNHKKVHRICREEHLQVPRRRRKRLKRPAVTLAPATRVNQRWAMDFVQDAMADGRILRMLTIEDTYSREGLAIVVDTSISGLRVRRELDRLIAERERPEEIRVDNGAEFPGRAVTDIHNLFDLYLIGIRPTD